MWPRLLLASLTLTVACRHENASSTGVARSEASGRAKPVSSAKDGIESFQRLALGPVRGTTSSDTALTQLQALAKAKPGEVDSWILLGRAWVKKARESAEPQHFANANACAEMALQLVPGLNLARDLQALVLLDDRKFEEARRIAQAVVEERPDDTVAFGNLSDALLELGRYDEAQAAGQRMIDLKPDLPSYGRASYFRWLAGDAAGAKDLSRKAFEAGGPKDAEARAWVLVQSAMFFWNEGDFVGADAGLALALESQSDYTPALVSKGRVALSRGNAKEAIALLQRAFARSPLVETAWLLGDALEQSGDGKGAREAYAIVEDKGRVDDPRALSLYWSTKNVHPEDALALAQEERKTRGDITTDDALAWALYRNRRFAEARIAIDRALRMGTKDAQLIFHSGAIRMALGDAKGGRRLVSAALALNPMFDLTGAAEARKIVADR